MSPAQDSGGGETDRGDAAPSVLAKLPRTRPQRASARRTAARSANGGPPEAPSPPKPARRRKADAGAPQRSPKPSSASATATKRSAPSAKRTAPAKASRQRARRAPATGTATEPVPRQGFESEPTTASGSVPPPGGAEFIATAGEIVSEVARASVSTGERLLRDALSRLRP